MVQQIAKRSGIDAHHRLGVGNDPVIGQGNGDADRGAGTALNAHGIDDRYLPFSHHEFDLHLFAQALAGRDAKTDKVGKYLGGRILKRGAA